MIEESKFLALDDSWNGDVTENQLTPTMLVACPVCGDTYNHIAGTKPLEGWEGRDPNSSNPRWAGRGNGVAVEMYCESGHHWNLCLGFHKGNTSLFTTRNDEREDKSSPPGDAFGPFSPTEEDFSKD